MRGGAELVEHQPLMKLHPLVPIFVMLSLQVFFAGCSPLQKPESSPEPLHLYVRSAEPVYQPGELVSIEVFLLNASNAAIEATPLNHETLTFWVQTPNVEEPLRAEPVFSAMENTLEAATIESGGVWSRTFFFTRASRSAGEVTVQGTYLSDPARLLADPRFAAARPIQFAVAGERLLERDRDGLILQSEAERLAREYWNAPDAGVAARLILNEAGFYDWAVIEGDERAVLVSPYRGAVRREADPAALQKEKEQPRPLPVFKQDETPAP